MADHEHTWSPIAGMTARYVCACGATAWKNHRTGILRVHVTPHHIERTPTAQPSTVADRLGDGNRWVPPLNSRYT